MKKKVVGSELKVGDRIETWCLKSFARIIFIEIRPDGRRIAHTEGSPVGMPVDLQQEYTVQ
jgi:hypothetical protein